MKGYVLAERLEKRGIKVRCLDFLTQSYEAVNGDKRLDWQTYGHDATVYGPFTSDNAPPEVRKGSAMDKVRWLAGEIERAGP